MAATLQADTLKNASSAVNNITLDTAGNATVGNTLAMGSSFLRNRIINGACAINQRGSNLSTNNSYGYYVDRMWGFSGASTAATYSQISSTGLAGFPYAMRAQRNSGSTGTGGVYTGQIVESNNLQDLQGQPVSISFWARKGADYSGSSSQLTVYIRTGTVADQGLATLVSPGWTGSVDQTSNVTLTTSWQKFTVTTFTVGSSVQELTVFFQPPPTASTAGTNDYYDVTGVQLEVGSVATPFERRQYGQELALCQRYLPYFSYASGANPYFGAGMVTSLSSSTTAWFTIQFPVTPRVPPTGIVVSAASHFAAFLPSTATTNATGVTFGGANSFGANFNLSGLSGTTAGQSSLCFMNNSAAVMYFTGCEL